MLLKNHNENDVFLNILKNRKTTRHFIDNHKDDDKIQILSDILWASNGFNREDKRVIPTAMNEQDLNVYLLTKDKVYFYNAEKNELQEYLNKNLFGLFVDTDSQEFMHHTNYVLLYTSKNAEYGAFHIGSAYQNVAIYCAENNIGNVVKGWFDKEAMIKELKLDENSFIMTQVLDL